MRKPLTTVAVVDGTFGGCVFFLFMSFLASIWSQGCSIGNLFIIGTICVLVTTVLYLLLLVRSKEIERITDALLFHLISGVGFVVMVLILTVLPFRVFPMGDDNPGNGLLLLLVGGFYLILSVLLRVSLILVTVIKSLVKKIRKGPQ